MARAEDRRPTVVCVLRSGRDYDTSHVIALYKQVREQWPSGPLHFVALADAPVTHPAIHTRALRHAPVGPLIDGWWAKMALFHSSQRDLGDILYIDLDTLIVGDLTDIAQRGAFTMLNDFGNPWAAQSGLMYLPVETRDAIWAEWLKNPTTKRARGDGELIDSMYRDTVHRWQAVLPGQVISYKYHVRQNKGLTVPTDARVICYHGEPRPWDTPLWKRYTLPILATR